MAGGGTVTLPESVALSVPWAPFAAGSPALGPSPPRTFWLPIGDWGILGACGGTCPPNAGSLLGAGFAVPAGIHGGSSSALSSGEPAAGTVLPLPLPLDLPRTGSAWVDSLPAEPFPAPGSAPGPAPGPESAAGVKDGDGGDDGVEENLGMRAAVVACAPVPDACGGADRDGTGP